MAKDFGAKAVIAIGGGSPTDAGKSVAILLEYPEKTAEDIYDFTFAPEKAAPIISINLTHGTGTETNRFAVVTNLEKNFKPAIAYDCIYPMFAIDDPQLMTKLSPKQTRYVSIDAVNHVVELTAEEKAEARQNAVRRYQEEELRKLQNRNRPSAKKETQSQPSLFDLGL